jgi:signal transduction histidine kinase
MTNLPDEVLAALLALLVHDLRNPLSALHSNIDFVGSCAPSTEDPELRGALDDALASCDALGGIIDNIEMLSQALSRVQHPKRPEPLAAALRAVIQRYQAAAQSHGVTLELLPYAEQDLLVTTHRGMLERAVGNLIKNAIQHAPSGSAVRVAVKDDAGKCRIEVRDAGRALDEAARAHAFSAEGQLASKTTSRYSRGLGLLCARLAADASGAELRACASRDGTSVLALSLMVAK